MSEGRERSSERPDVGTVSVKTSGEIRAPEEISRHADAIDDHANADPLRRDELGQPGRGIATDGDADQRDRAVIPVD
ncbi:hypothetical protein D3C87_1935910 [compost metagenome]